MTVYALQRLLGLVPVLFGISVVIFLTMKLIPGDVARALLGPMATDQSLAQLRHALGLDEAIYVQYVKWLWRALHGDLGISVVTHEPVFAEFAARFPATVELSLVAMLFAQLLLFINISGLGLARRWSVGSGFLAHAASAHEHLSLQ